MTFFHVFRVFLHKKCQKKCEKKCEKSAKIDPPFPCIFLLEMDPTFFDIFQLLFIAKKCEKKGGKSEKKGVKMVTFWGVISNRKVAENGGQILTVF